jgi:hypothetical protein
LGRALVAAEVEVLVGDWTAMKLSESQWRALRVCAAKRDDEEWQDLSGLGFHRPTIRALLDIGAIEPKKAGFPGQLFGQEYRITLGGRAALAERQKQISKKMSNPRDRA